MPIDDLTLIAGTDDNFVLNLFIEKPNDTIVTMSSVFNYPTGEHDGTKTLFNVPKRLHTSMEGFNHFNFGTEYRVNIFRQKIREGLSDWTVAKLTEYEYVESSATQSGHARVQADVDYNVHQQSIDSVVLVIYAKDISGNWHIIDGSGNGADHDGKINSSKVSKINGTSGQDGAITQELTAYIDIPANSVNDPEHIIAIEAPMISLTPGQKTVPLIPDGNFRMPE